MNPRINRQLHRRKRREAALTHGQTPLAKFGRANVRFCHSICLSLMLESLNILLEPENRFRFNIGVFLKRVDHLVYRRWVSFIDMFVQISSQQNPR